MLGSYSQPLDINVDLASDVYTLTSGQYNPEHWSAKLLIDPHVATNEADVNRLRSNHPVHELEFLIRDQRLLGKSF